VPCDKDHVFRSNCTAVLSLHSWHTEHALSSRCVPTAVGFLNKTLSVCHFKFIASKRLFAKWLCRNIVCICLMTVLCCWLCNKLPRGDNNILLFPPIFEDHPGALKPSVFHNLCTQSEADLALMGPPTWTALTWARELQPWRGNTDHNLDRKMNRFAQLHCSVSLK